MNKCIRTLFVSVFAISLVLMAGSSTVNAVAWANPWTVPVSGDLVFTSTAVSPVTLAGAEKTDSGLIVPVGFRTGERQFGGNALVVSGLSGGSANACFSFPTYRYGWRGGVYEWTGSKWMPLPTTIGNPEAKEGAPSTACAPIYGNGTFALIINFNEGKAPNQVIHECTNIEFVSPDFNFLEGDWIEIIGGYIYPSIPVGTIVTYEILNISPPDALDGALSGGGSVVENLPSFEPLYPEDYSHVLLGESNLLEYSVGLFDMSFTVRMYFTGCYKDLNYPGNIVY